MSGETIWCSKSEKKKRIPKTFNTPLLKGPFWVLRVKSLYSFIQVPQGLSGKLTLQK